MSSPLQTPLPFPSRGAGRDPSTRAVSSHSIPRAGETLMGFFVSQDYILKQPLEEYLK